MKTIQSLAFVVAVSSGLLLGTVQVASADQPNMKEAVGHLRAARAALERAEANKAGHRERAMELIDKAISECQEGMKDAK